MGRKVMEISLAAGLAFEASAIQSIMLKSIMEERKIMSLIPISISGNFINLSLGFLICKVETGGKGAGHTTFKRMTAKKKKKKNDSHRM